MVSIDAAQNEGFNHIATSRQHAYMVGQPIVGDKPSIKSALGGSWFVLRSDCIVTISQLIFWQWRFLSARKIEVRIENKLDPDAVTGQNTVVQAHFSGISIHPRIDEAMSCDEKWTILRSVDKRCRIFDYSNDLIPIESIVE